MRHSNQKILRGVTKTGSRNQSKKSVSEPDRDDPRYSRKNWIKKIKFQIVVPIEISKAWGKEIHLRCFTIAIKCKGKLWLTANHREDDHDPQEWYRADQCTDQTLNVEIQRISSYVADQTLPFEQGSHLMDLLTQHMARKLKKK